MMQEDVSELDQLFVQLQRMYNSLCPGKEADEDTDYQQLYNEYKELSDQIVTLLEIHLR